ncbi:helix-turn-helix domain-containing protein [Paenibacillus swuensis]|uniref:helix-turn-helix domain-containing protein n=1 Tax=Paenibacillus swuensis TaxID=1178515 RepID=UPI000839397F|nr:AraC family transcriptional regulator [Paenibacillus swuensis]
MIGREYTRHKKGSGEKQKIAYHHEAFHKAIRYIDNHYDKELRLEELAALSHMSPSSFSSMLKMVTGSSYIDYVTNLRLKSAANLLRTTDLNVTEISLRTGYNHLGHFTKMFKRHTGLTPGEYRKLQNTFTHY